MKTLFLILIAFLLVSCSQGTPEPKDTIPSHPTDTKVKINKHPIIDAPDNQPIQIPEEEDK